jgi:ferric-dicitrate binding protein FerR (iron transport regulator)
VNLPDGSLVTLNANTQLRFSNDWKEGADREVWLEGEAFFVVEKKPATQAKFTVHSGSLDVEVLGTQFNVNNRSEKTSVFLQEGVIQLRIRENEKEELLMEEGSLAEFSREEGLRVQTVEAPQRYTSWKDGYILLDGMTLAEAKEKIESIYGLEMVISRDSLLFTNLEGALPSSDLGELLQTLEILLPVKVTKNESTILLE